MRRQEAHSNIWVPRPTDHHQPREPCTRCNLPAHQHPNRPIATESRTFLSKNRVGVCRPQCTTISRETHLNF